MDVLELCDVVRQTAYDIHIYHGQGYLEKVYENALMHRLQKAGFRVEQQYPLKVHDEDGAVIGEYFADLIVENELFVELKTCSRLLAIHEAQVLSYLKAAKCKHGLLINFGSYKFEIRKFAL